MTDLAPVVLFAYNRPTLTQQTLDTLAVNTLAGETKLYIFCDGPKPDAAHEQMDKIARVRHIALKEKRFANVEVIERKNNWGLAKSIIAGVTEIVRRHGKIIVLEDDLITSPYFLQYMNDALALYENEPCVLSVNTCNFFAVDPETPATFFTRVPDCYGWGTWSDRWALFEPDSKKLLAEVQKRGMEKRVNLDGAFNYMWMLRNQAEGRISSWAIRWHATGILNDKLNLYPNPALTNHVTGDSSTHSQFNIVPPLASAPIIVEKVPLEETAIILAKMKKGYAHYDNRWVKLWNHISARVNKWSK